MYIFEFQHVLIFNQIIISKGLFHIIHVSYKVILLIIIILLYGII